MYQTTVKGKGIMVDAFKEEGMFISFGNEAPDTLKDFCYSVEISAIDGEITPGCKLIIDGRSFEIVKVGDLANRNLAELGHVTYNFNGLNGECLPGTICVEKAEVPTLEIGSTIQITK